MTEYKGLVSTYNEIIGGMIGQFLCLYFLLRFAVEYKRNIQKMSKITVSHVEGICVWIFGLIYFTVHVYFYKNLLHLNIDYTHCILYQTITNAAKVWLQTSFYLQFTSAIKSVSNISNIPLAVSPNFISNFRYCIIACGLVLQIFIILTQAQQKNQKTETINDWITCYISSDFYDTIIFKLSQTGIAVIITVLCLVFAIIAVKQASLVNKNFIHFVANYETQTKIHNYTCI